MLSCIVQLHQPVTTNTQHEANENTHGTNYALKFTFRWYGECRFKRRGNCPIRVMRLVGCICKTSCKRSKAFTICKQLRLCARFPRHATTQRMHTCASLPGRRPPLNCTSSSWLKLLPLLNLGSVRRNAVTSASNTRIGMPRLLLRMRCRKAASQLSSGEQTMLPRPPPPAFTASSAACSGWLLSRGSKVQRFAIY